MKKENREMKRGEGGEREKKGQGERFVSHSQTLTQKVGKSPMFLAY